MPLSNHRLPEPLLSWLDQWILSEGIATPIKIETLAGDGSPRTFFRLRLSASTRILLYDPQWSLSKDYPALQAFLESRGISVPQFFKADPQAGCLVMQDLGDEHLQQHLLKYPNEKSQWLEKAVLFLADFHGKTYPVPIENPATGRPFDGKKYSQELLFTMEHLQKGLLRMPAVSDSQTKEIQKFAETLAKMKPRIFCHRDYHTRNLLVTEGHLFMIDFQDARLGPPHYDLASLLYDAYVPISQPERAQLQSLYQEKLSEYPLAMEIDWENFEADLAQVAYQRVIKAAGSFAYFYQCFKKRTHLPYLEPALTYALELEPRIPALTKELKSIFKIEAWLEKIKELDLP